MTKRQWIIIGSIAGLLAVSYGLMRLLIALKPDLPLRAPLIIERWVKAEPAVYQSIFSSVKARGRVVSSAEVEVVAEASGRIESGDVPLKKGQSFRKDQVLLTIYKDEAELALKAQKSRFLNVVANLLPDIKVDYQEFYATFRKFFTAIQIDAQLPPLPQIDHEPMRIFLASRNVLADYYAIEQAELKLSRHTIKAPFNGVFVTVNLEAGAYTNTGGRIGRILATEALEVDVSVGNGNAHWIKTGDPVVLTSERRDKTWKGNVVRVSEFVDETTQSRSVFVSVPLDTQGPLYAGEYLTAKFEGAPVENVMKIPRNALFNYNEVFTVRESLLKIEEVVVVKLTETEALIRGPEENIYVVTQPLINVAENTPVKIMGVDTISENDTKNEPAG
jgi:multidrug efflux pump subunit AcrA (membrane-fusion protein)